MGRLFAVASEEYLTMDTAPLTALPFSMACWFFTDSGTTEQGLMWLGYRAESNQMHVLLTGSGAGSGKLWCRSRQNSSSQAQSTANYATDVWQHGAGVWRTTSDRSVYLNGARDNNIETKDPTPPNGFALGGLYDSTASNWLSGKLGECGLWNIALSDDSITSLSQGASPLHVRPDALVGYWPVLGTASPEPGLINNHNLTLKTIGSGPVIDDHPPTQSRFFYGALGGFATAAGPPAPTIQPGQRVMMVT